MATIDVRLDRLAPAEPHVAYRALREECAVFAHHGAQIIDVTGTGAEQLLQATLARDIEFLTPERCLTSLVLDGDGAAIDAVTVFRLDDGFLIETSPGRHTDLVAHLTATADAEAVEDVGTSADTGLEIVSVEGPYAWGAAGRIVSPELAALPLDSVISTTWNDEPIQFARSGSTGEYGYKFIASHDVLLQLADELVEDLVVAPDDVLQVAMVEVGQPRVTGPTSADELVERGWTWLVDAAKAEFTGRSALLGARERCEHQWFGFEGSGDPFPLGLPVTTADGHEVGTIASSWSVPASDRVLGHVRLPADVAAAGLELDADGRSIRTVPQPFILPNSWKTPIL